MTGTLAAGAICTKPTDCKVAKSCCAIWNTKADLTGTASTLKACVADATAAKAAVKITVDNSTAGQKYTDFVSCTASPCTGYLAAKCTGVAAGANTLAVSAAVAATAVYMM